MDDIKLPPEFPSNVVYEAFKGLKNKRWVRSKLHALGGVSIAGKPLMFNPDVLREHFPRIYRRCCELLTERAVSEKTQEKKPKIVGNW
jgi:hypothetical protein